MNLFGKSLIVALFAAIFILSSCSSKSKNISVIPKNTDLVAVVDIEALAVKGKVNELTDLKLFRTFKKELRKENKRIAVIVEDALEDPSVTGVELRDDVFLFAVNEAKDEQFMAISIGLADNAQFEEFIDNLLHDSRADYDIEDEDNYHYTVVNERIGIAWDENKALFLLATNYKSRENIDLSIETLFTLKEGKQITLNEEFNAFYEDKGDVSLWMSTNLFENERQFERYEEEFDVDLSDNFVVAHLNFDKDGVALTTSLQANSEIQDLIDENLTNDQEFNSSLLNYFPKTQYFTSSIVLNPKDIYSNVRYQNEFERFDEEFEEETQNTLKNLFSDLKGSVLFSVFGFEDVEYTYKSYGYAFDPEMARKLDKRYLISEAGSLSEEDKKLLNEGQTIKAPRFSEYCINIKNILNEGGDIYTALEYDREINWYEGGWEFGRNIESTNSELLPLFSLAFDLESDEIIKDVLKNLENEELVDQGDYYSFKLDRKYPAYLMFNDDVCIITNDLKTAKNFKSGGIESATLADSDIASNIKSANFYTLFDLNYEAYPKEVKKMIRANQSRSQGRRMELLEELLSSFEVIQSEENTIEFKLRLKTKNGQSLNTIITAIDENFKDFM